jgi:iron complex outermembrane recepter protein
MALALSLGGAPALSADEPEADVLELQPVVVTGSRIPRPDFESASPVITIDAEAFEQAGAPTVEEALNRYPQFVPTFSSTSNNPSANGQAQLDLRGLGPQATLVLLDGRRLTPANGAGVADVNVIPKALIERVEISSGGASAVYGSDAVAGVVNFILRDSFEGFELDGFYGQTDRGDGEQWDLQFTAGTSFAGGRGSAYGSVGRAERRIVTHGDRTFSRYVLGYVGPGQGRLGPGDAFIPQGNFLIEEGFAFLPIVGTGADVMSQDAFDALFESYGHQEVPFQQFLGFNLDGTLFTTGTGAPGSVVNYRYEPDPLLFSDRAVSYNFAPPNALQLPLERTSAFGRLEFDLTDSTRLYADVLLADYEAVQQLAPASVFGAFLPRSNPYIPDDLAFLLDSRPDPDAEFRWFKRVSEVGPRVARNEHRVWQGAAGIDGYIFDAWRFDAYAQQGEVQLSTRQSGNILRSRIIELTHSPDGGLAACGGFDIFGLGSIPQACADYIAVAAANESRARRFVAEASLEGPLLELPAGDLRTAFGIFHKRDRFFYTADPIASVFLPDGNPDIQGFNASDDLSGEERNTDLYVEALVPVARDRPGIVALEAGFGYRRSEYDAAGSADAVKLELLYRPVDALRLRTSYQNAVRAPSVFELFEPQLPARIGLPPATGFPNGLDPCDVRHPARGGPDAAAIEALCLAQGIPPELLPTYQNPFLTAAGFMGGNRELDPEKADTWTVGLVWSAGRPAARLGGLQASIDWYRIEVDGAIQQVSGAEVVSLCFDPVANPDFSADNEWCTYFSRDPAQGIIVDLFEINRNVGKVETSGVDLQLDWRRSLGPGTLGANWLISWLDYYMRHAGGNAPTEELSGQIAFLPGTSLPEWKSLLSLSYSWQGFALTGRTRYIGSMRRAEFPEFEIPSRSYVDVFASYDFGAGLLDGLRLGLGIQNLTDRDPPIMPFGIANTDPQQYDVLGRRYFLTLNYRW